jgi:uncharacterized protein (TIGR00251 family)
MIDELAISEQAGAIVFEIHVQPRASKNEICGLHGGALKVRLTSPPVEGAANRLCEEFFAKLLGVAKSRVAIIAGDKSRHKRLKVEGVTREAVLQVLLKDKSR